MAINKTQSTRTVRSHSFSGLSVSLNLDQLERFLRHTIHRFTDDRELAALAQAQFVDLAVRCQRDGMEACQDDLLEAASVLEAFLSSSREIPADVVYECHTLVGLLRERLQQHKSALPSLMKALWISSSTEDVTPDQMGLTLHRLGNVYGASGNFKEARNLLEKALIVYEQVPLNKGHPCVVSARRALEDFSRKYSESDEWSSLRVTTRRLSYIKEEPEPTPRRLSV